MAMFQPFKAATQRKGSAVNDLMMQQQVDAARREMQAQNLAGATSIAKWGLGKDTSPWADSLYGAEAAAPTENALSTALRMEGPATEGFMSGINTGAPAAEAGLVDSALATGAEGSLSGLSASALPAAGGTAAGAGAGAGTAAAGAGAGTAAAGAGTAAAGAGTAAAAGGAAAGATPALAALGPIGMGIGGLLLARQLGVFG